VFASLYVGLGYMLCLVGLPLPHSGTECRTVSLEQSNSVLQQCSLSICTPKSTKRTKPLV